MWTGGEWRWDNRAGARSHLLYRLSHVLDAVHAGERVYLVDSEASADRSRCSPEQLPDDIPEPVYGRSGRVRVHTRDLLTTTATQALGTDVYSTIVQHLVETSALMRAGATVVTTETGENLVVPRSTGFVTSAITAEGAAITESDPPSRP